MFFFLIPVNTDAPIYYWPWTTLSLIVANSLLYFAAVAGVVSPEWEGWILTYGGGLHPLEWLTCNFVHFNFIHLLFNMIFLWGFGLVVEGKLGWWRFLLLYLGIGLIYALGIQLLMLGYDGDSRGAGGASGIIFGLLAIAMVWAPKNEMICFAFFWFAFVIRAFTFEVTILTFAIFYLISQMVWMLVDYLLQQQFVATSEVLHLTGAVIGFAIGTVMLKQKWVDCENWDLFAVWKGSHGNNNSLETYRYGSGSILPDTKSWAAESNVQETDDAVEISTQRSAFKKKTLKKLRQFISDAKPTAAIAELRNLKHMWSSFQLPQPDLRQLIQIIWETENWTAVVPLMEEYAARFPGNDLHLEL
ncbi:MAG: rhomboid family intramembrane serine protease, partial [Planctomycetaceae bacterium]